MSSEQQQQQQQHDAEGIGATKLDAVQRFGTVGALARAIGCTPAAISQWPARLTPRQRDRVQAALFRQQQRAQDYHAPLAPSERASDVVG